MNDTVTYNFSYSYNLGSSPQTQKEEALIAFDDCLEFPLPEQRILIRSKHSGRQIIVTNDVLYSLHLCREFRTMTEHVEHLGRQIPELENEQEDIRQALSSIQQAGLMLSAQNKAAGIQPAAPEPPRPQRLCFCILSCDRTESLSRLLETMAANHRFLAQNRYYVVDDSRQKENRDRNLQLCREFSSAHGMELRYFGMEAQNKILARLKEQLPEHAEGLDFLLGRCQDNPAIPSYGRTRNWGLLLGAGRKAVLIDDDILFQRVEPPQNQEEIAITSKPRGAEFFRSDDEWHALYNPQNTDPSANLFSTALGATLAEALSLCGTKALRQQALRNLHPMDFPHVEADSRILLTSCGYAGDPGTTSNTWIYQLPEHYRKRLLASEQDYRHHITARNTWLGSFAPAFRRQLSLMSPMMGIDASRLTPPFFPLYRNEDLLFGQMLHFLHPGGLFLDAPWAVPHLPATRRQWKKDLALTPQNYGLLDFSSDALALEPPSFLPHTASERLRACGDFFSRLGGLSDQMLTEQIARLTLGLRSTQACRIDQVLETGKDAPDFWKNDLQKIIQSNKQSLAMPLPGGFQGLPGGEEGQRALARALWIRFAQGIQAWEACMNIMQEIQMEAS
ncbi:hypothetical protein [Thiolapillus sp.]